MAMSDKHLEKSQFVAHTDAGRKHRGLRDGNLDSFCSWKISANKKNKEKNRQVKRDHSTHREQNMKYNA